MALVESSTPAINAKVRSAVRRATMDLGYLTIHVLKASRCESTKCRGLGSLDFFPGIDSAFYHYLVIRICFEIRKRKIVHESGNEIETCIRPRLQPATLANTRLVQIKSYSAYLNTKLLRPRQIFIPKMAPQPILLILGAGPRLGSAIASKFASQNFKVVLASRSLSDGVTSPEGYLQLSADLSNPGSVGHVFGAIKAHLGAPPTIVVYNGALRLINLPDDPFALPLENVKGPLAVGWESAYVAAQEAVKGFSEIEEEENDSAFEVGKTFIFTGNALNQVPLPEVFAFGVAKRAAAALVEYGANAYGRNKGYRWDKSFLPDSIECSKDKSC